MKLTLRPKQFLLVAFLVAFAAVSAKGAIVIDVFGEPHQTISITGSSVSVSSPYSDGDPMSPTFGPLVSVGANGIRQNSGTYGGLTGDVTNGAGTAGYDGTVSSTFYAYANSLTREGGIVSSAPGGGLTDFSQRDVLLTVTGGPGNVTFTAGQFELSGLAGGSSTLLLQYDGVDLDAAIDLNVTGGSGPAEVGGTVNGTAFINGQRLDDGIGLAGYDLLAGGNNGFYFGGVIVDADGGMSTIAGVDVTVRVWTAGNPNSQLATAVFADTNGMTASYAVLFSAFNGGTGAINFGQVTGVDILFTLENDEDIYLASGPSGGLTATTPEPATLAIWSLLGLGGVGMGYFRRRKLTA